MGQSKLELAVGTGQWDAGLKKAQQALNSFTSSQGGLQKALEKDNGDMQKFIQMMSRMESTANTAKGRMNDYKRVLEQLTDQYNRMNNAQKNSEIGRQYARTIDEIKKKFHDASIEAKDFSKSIGEVEQKMPKAGLGDLNGILSQIGGQMGINTSMLSGLTAGTMGYAAAVAAVVKVEYEAAKAFKEYNDEMARQQEITTVTTGLKGGDADNMTAAARSISKVYGTDFREVINAANTLMTQFGKTGDEAIQLIRDGMQGMIMGDGGKLLNMIKQYAPSFRDAGIEASQLIAIIQNSEGGLFTDENMNAIVMGIKNIRLMTKATNDALKQIGVDGDDITKRLNDGTMTIFEAMGKVSEALQEVQSGGQDAGQVMQQVFGRQGTAAGTNLAKAIATLNTNLEETKTKTGELGESFAKLEQANEKLEKAMMKTFEVKGWEEMWNIIETNVISAFADVVDILGDINHMIDNVGNTFEDVFGAGGGVVQYITDFVIALTSPLGLLKEMVKYTKMLTGAGNDPGAFRNEKAEGIYKQYVGQIEGAQDKTAGYSAARAELLKRANIAYRHSKDAETEKQRQGYKEAYEIYKEVIQKIDDYMDSYFDQIGKTESTFKPETTTTDKKVKKEINIDDLVNAQHPEQGYEGIGQSYGEQIMQGIMVGMAKKAEEADVNTMKNLMETIVKNGIEGIDIPANTLMEQILGDGADIPDSYWQDIVDEINKKLKENPIELDFTTGAIKLKKPEKKEDKEKYLADGLSKLAGGMGGLQSGFQQLGIDLGSGFNDVVSGLQGISSILMAIQTIVSAIEIISSADAIIPFSNGGVVHAASGFMVPGNTYSGDMIPAALNAGEVVLNRAQAGVLAADLEGGGARHITVSGRLEGETIVLAADRWGRRTGKGELAFWK